MSKKLFKRSLALGALMAFVITGSAMAADYDAANGPYSNQTVESNANHTYGAFSKNGTVTVNGAKFEANKTVQNGSYVSYGGAMFVIGNLEIDNSKFIGNSVYGVTSNAVHGGAVAQQDGELKISGSTFDGNKVLNPTNKDGKVSHDSYGAAIYSGGSGDVYIENSVIENQDGGRAVYIKADKETKTATFKDNKFLNNNRGSVQAENASTILNFEGKNEFKDNVDPTGVEAETLFNKGTTNFKTDSETIFSGNQLDIKNKGIINIEDDAVVSLGTGMTGNGTVNIAGTLNGRVSEDNSILLNDGGTWNVAGESVVKGIVVNGDATIAGVDKDSSVTLNKKITESGNYAILHNGGKLTISNLILENIEKEYITPNDTNGKSEVVYGAVLYSSAHNSGDIIISQSTVQNNKHNGDEKNYAVMHITNSNVRIEKSNFINNQSDYMGGALIYSTGELNINESNFTNNASNEGGAIIVNNATVNLNGGNTIENANIFKGNDARTGNGGAINTQGNVTEANLTGYNTFEKNVAKDGGAVWLSGYVNPKSDEADDIGTTLNIDGVVEFKDNVATGNGGAVYSQANTVVEFNGEAMFKNNTANGKANDIHNDGTVNIKKGANVTLNGGMTGSGIVNVNGTLQLGGAISGKEVTFGVDSNLVLKGKGAQFTTEDDFALNGDDKGVLTVDKGALITVEGMTKATYNVATGFENIISEEYWTVVNDNALMKAVWNDKTNGTLLLEVTAKDAGELTGSGATSESTSELIASITDAISNGTVEQAGEAGKAAADFIQNVVANNPTPEGIKQATDAATKMAEEVGQSAIAASIVKNVTDITNDRLSFNCGHSAPHKGGHGVGLLEEGSGADIWVEYVHGKDEVEDMPSTAGKTSYEGQYNGIVMGVDFKKVNKFQSGIAFNYGEGDTNSLGSSVRTHSDYDFWGVGYYGNIHNDDSNVIFDINYAKTDSDVTQYNSSSILEASPETTTWSAGVKLEKLYQNENVQIVPYTGLRYMSIDADDYSTKKGEFYYSMDRQDIWLLPLGVSIRQEIANDNGWTVSPRVDLSYIWAFGDTNSNMEVKSPFAGVSQLGYDVMDDGSFLGLVGIEAHKGQWGYGVSYSYQKGDHSESKKWYVDVNYSF